MICPDPLLPGDTIGVMSPSSFVEKNDLDEAVALVESYGYNLYVHPQTFNRHHQSAGTNEEKLNAFHDLIKNPNINAIVFSTGGNRALHWVDQIDYDLVKNNPKIIMGFSDTTSILNLIAVKSGLKTFHGPNLRWFMVHKDNSHDIKQCFTTLSNPSREFSYDGLSGTFVGGNASVIQYLINDIDLTGKILFLEDWNLESSHLDRIFMHMKRQNVFEKINGLILGQFDNLSDTGKRPYGFTLNDIITEHVPDSLPIVKNAPIGHSDRLITIPIG
jgi:muramoyltetrapeptide carboxypeptidase